MTTEPVTASVHINAPPERVFEYFTRPEAILTWMGEAALLEAQPGGRFHIDIKGVPVRGRYLDLDPPRRLVISWGYAVSGHLPPGSSTVEIRLTAEHGGTRVELEHRDLPAGERPGHASGWTHYLARLALAATGQAPGPDPGMPQVTPADNRPQRGASSLPPPDPPNRSGRPDTFQSSPGEALGSG